MWVKMSTHYCDVVIVKHQQCPLYSTCTAALILGSVIPQELLAVTDPPEM